MMTQILTDDLIIHGGESTEERAIVLARQTALNAKLKTENVAAWAAAEAEKTAKHQAELDAAMMSEARRDWLAAGGDSDTFESEWPTLKTEIVRARVLERQNAVINAKRAEMSQWV